MPRIDPLQLLKCLSVLLSPEGGIMSREEVPRLVNLMTKFSKKLVSKCVYLLILKSTDVTLVDMFMASGGWLLIQTWLQEAMASSNWNLVQEVLELLLTTPVDSSRLRLNNIPKLVKTLSKREDLGDVKEMAASLVNNWLAIVKSSTSPMQELEKPQIKIPDISVQSSDINKDEIQPEMNGEVQKVTNEIETVELTDPPTIEDEPTKMEVEDENAISTGMFYKITVRDGKQVITKLATTEEIDEKQVIDEVEVGPESMVENKDEEMKEKVEEDSKENKNKKDETKSKSSSSSSSKSSSSSGKRSSSSSSSKSSNSSSSSSKDKDRRHSSSSKHSSKSSSSSSSRDKDKDRDRSRKDKDKENDKDKHRNNGSLKHSSSKTNSSSSSSNKEKDKTKKDSREPKEKQAEKDKDTLAKLKPATLDKIGRIPKKSTTTTSSSSSTDEKDKDTIKKPSMSIEPKKKAEDRPKTVKIFNSKMRSTGLEEEAKPPPPRNAVKKPPPVLPPVLPFPAKRTSPTRDPLATPPEKKMKIEMPERAGSIKLIPPKPKPPVLLESDIFMDALTAATSKKEPKKRKRKLSISKESPENSPTIQPPGATSPLGLKNFTPANFYQDTLENTNDAEESKAKVEEATEDRLAEEKTEEKEDKPMQITETTSEIISEPTTRTNSDGLRGVLVYTKKKGPKKSIKWKEEKDLVEIKYFELDETERVNVSRPNFTDMAKLEMTNEREALMGRKLMNEDLMEPTTLWIIPYLVDQPELPVQPGCKSLEKDIQYAREKNILQALYFNKSLIPDCPAEPIPETHPMVDPVIIPLEDSESQNYDLRNTPWPEPKGAAPVEQPPVVTVPPMFQTIPGPFPSFTQMPPQGFPPMQPPGFCPPNMMPNGPPNMLPNNNMNMMGNPNMNMGPPMEMMNQMNPGPMNPNMFGPGVQNMDTFNPMMNENPNFPMNPMNFNPPNMYGPPANNFNMERGGHRGRGNFRRGHNNNGNWGRNVARGGSNWRNTREDHRGGTGRICKNIKNHGYCRNIENCPFVHPN